MNSLAFVTHPSVRIKGTENNYTPTVCLDERCPIKAPHMHCPFCVKTDAYQDPVILKAHYRVKHVDKGIEFAGLKILRCCDHCDIVGIIKGEKRFKGAHWHCYRCRNGFNRRDEAIKHYKTHFRNPQTTFQIQITQDLNLPSGVKGANHQHQEVINQQNFTTSIENPIQDILHSDLSQTSLSEQPTTDGNSNTKYKKVKVKEEPMLATDDPRAVDQGQTIMIIQGDDLESAFADHIIHSGGEVSVLDKNSIDSNLSWEIRCRMEEEEKNEYKARMEEYKNQMEVLQQRVQELETQQPSQLRVQDLLASLSLGNSDKQLLAQQISKYLEELQSQETDMSHQDSQDLVTSEGIIHQLSSNESGDGQLTSVVQTSLAQELQSGSVVTHLGTMNEPYHVITSDSNSHSIIINHAEANSISDIPHQSQDIIVNSDDRISTSVIEDIPTTADGGDQLFTPVTSVSHDQEIIVTQVMPSEVQTNGVSENFLISESGISQGEHSIINIDSNTENRLLQVMAASSEQEGQDSDTFIMETESGQRIIIQRRESADTGQDISNHKLDPETKRPRIA